MATGQICRRAAPSAEDLRIYLVDLLLRDPGQILATGQICRRAAPSAGDLRAYLVDPPVAMLIYEILP